MTTTPSSAPSKPATMCMRCVSAPLVTGALSDGDGDDFPSLVLEDSEGDPDSDDDEPDVLAGSAPDVVAPGTVMSVVPVCEAPVVGVAPYVEEEASTHDVV